MAALYGFLGSRTKDAANRMHATMHHRGTHDSNEYRPNHAAGQHLPRYKSFNNTFSKQGTDFLVTFDGDIFNKQDLKNRLTQEQAPRTDDDTELVLCLYLAFGNTFPNLIEGNFALSISDGSSLYLARDSLGMRPLFYTHEDTTIVFASTIKAVRASLTHAPQIDTESLQERFVFGDHLLGDSTYILGIKTVLPGHYLLATQGTESVSVEHTPYVSYDTPLPTDKESLRALLAHTVERNVRYYAELDARVGVLLSGGFDSSVLTGLLVEARNTPVDTFTISDDPSFPDIDAARVVAEHFGTRHHECIVPPALGLDDLREGVRAYEDLLVRETIFKLARQVSGKVDVALSGVGADFLGMPVLMRGHKFRRVQQRYERLQKVVAPQDLSPRLARYMAHFRLLLNESPAKASWYHFTHDYLPQQLFPSTERALMYFGIEPAFPFADPTLVRIAEALPVEDKYVENEEKPFLRDAFVSVKLPSYIHTREKLCSKHNLTSTKKQARDFISMAIADSYVETHPYKKLLDTQKYMIACFDIFSEAFLAKD